MAPADGTTADGTATDGTATDGTAVTPAGGAAPESLRDRTFRARSLRGSRFHSCDLAGVVIRGSDVTGLEIDSPWLFEGGNRLLVNGVDVLPFVDAELNRRFPGRELRAAEDVDGLRQAWSWVETAWGATVSRASAMAPGTVDAQIDGEWSLSQTLRHLVMATDTWLGRAVFELAEPYHPAGLPHDDPDTAAYDSSVFSQTDPTWDEVLAARASRQAMVRDYLATVTDDELSASRKNPHAPEHAETVRSCLHTILDEEWEHLRYAVRDLDQLGARAEA